MPTFAQSTSTVNKVTKVLKPTISYPHHQRVQLAGMIMLLVFNFIILEIILYPHVTIVVD